MVSISHTLPWAYVWSLNDNSSFAWRDKLNFLTQFLLSFDVIFCFVYSGMKESPSSLSNDGPDSIETIPDAVPTVFTEPPVEDQLAWNTLWPESHKLYGHGNELFSICCDYEGKLIASSCKVIMLHNSAICQCHLRNCLAIHNGCAISCPWPWLFCFY
jgi:hypothetical protein